MLDCQRELEKNGSGEARVRVAEFIAFLRQETEPAAPLKIEIMNAKDVFSPAKILTVKRSDDGKLSGATIEPVGRALQRVCGGEMIIGCLICVLVGLYVGIIIGRT